MISEPQTIADARAVFLRADLYLDPIPIQEPPDDGDEVEPVPPLR